MKKLSPMVALSLSACATSPNAQTAVVSETKADLQSYVAGSWDNFEDRLRRTSPMPPGKLEFVDVHDIRCDPVGGALSCQFKVTTRTETGELAVGGAWGTFAYGIGGFDEVIIVG